MLLGDLKKTDTSIQQNVLWHPNAFLCSHSVETKWKPLHRPQWVWGPWSCPTCCTPSQHRNHSTKAAIGPPGSLLSSPSNYPQTPSFPGMGIQQPQKGRLVPYTGIVPNVTSTMINLSPVPHPTLHHFTTEMHMCAHFCYKMLHYGVFVWCILGFVSWIYWF